MSNSQAVEADTKRTLRSDVRNPRRRPRQSDQDSMKTAPRRKRSKITSETFVQPRHDGENNRTVEATHANGSIARTDSKKNHGRSVRATDPRLDTTEMPLRNKKASIKRPTRNDGAAVLTQNERYSIKLMPSTPKELQGKDVDYRGSVGGGHHALAITSEHAYIWEYTSHASVANTRIFKLPFSVAASDPLPFGALVSKGTSLDFGLVLISATTGKIVYHESVERLASLGMFHDQSATVQGSIPSLWTGETVCDLIIAAHAGFVLLLSSGRLVHFTLHDAQGKARVSADILRLEQENSTGFFGSIKGYLGAGAYRKDTTAVRARPLDKRGKMQVVALTERAEMLSWDIEWNGRSSLGTSINLREALVDELRNSGLVNDVDTTDTLTAIDLAVMDNPESSDEVVLHGTEAAFSVMILTSFGGSSNIRYMLAEVSFEGAADPVCTRVLELETYEVLRLNDSIWKPRVLLPPPQHTALVYHQDAVTFVSLGANDHDGPAAQLGGAQPELSTFQDTAYLRSSAGIEILDVFADDHRNAHSLEASTAFIRGCGLVRICASDPRTSLDVSRIPAKTTLEQAIFHGALQDNVLDFSRKSTSTYSIEEIEHAALTISGEVLRSTCTYISTSPTSMEQHFLSKAEALRALALYVRQNYPEMSATAMWRLLWDAEKVVAGEQIWRAFEEHVVASSQKKRTATIVDEASALVLASLDESDQKTVLNNSDVTRNLLLHRLHHVDRLFLMAKDVLKQLRDDKDQSSVTKMRIVSESCDLWVGSLEAVFSFRAEHASVYGILPETIQDGILTDVADYVGLPEFWTSTESMLKAVVKMTNLTRELAASLYENSQDEATQQVLGPMVQKSGAQNPRLIQLSCLIYQERINWLASRPSQKDKEVSRRLQENYEKTRHSQIRALPELAQAGAGIEIAEKYRAFNTLTEMVLAESQFAGRELSMTTDEGQRYAIVKYMEDIRLRIQRYFERFGEDWANAYFDFGFSNHSGLMLNENQKAWHRHLTTYLRASPSRAKICWINDVLVGQDYSRAGRELAIAARDTETRLWHRKVELSMAKLAVLATEEGLEEAGTGMSDSELRSLLPEQDLTIVRAQQQLYNHIRPEILGLIDQQAELQEAIKRFGLKNQDLHTMRQLLYEGLDRVIGHEALSAPELIDVLTLMDVYITDDTDDNLKGGEFSLALQVFNAAASEMPQQRAETLLQLIWKRCYVYDDWITIDGGQKQGVSEDDTIQRLRATICWQTLYFALDQGLFDEHDSRVRHILPSGCLGAGCHPEDLAWRFPEPDLLDPILHDNRVHDEQLQGLVDDRRLDDWTRMIVSDVRNTISAERERKDLATQAVLAMDAAEEVGSVDSGAVNGAGAANGYSHAQPNGIKVEGRGEHDAETEYDDEDAGAGSGDVWESAERDGDVDVDDDDVMLIE